MTNPKRVKHLEPVPAAGAVSPAPEVPQTSAGEGVEFTAEFQALDAMVSAFDADADGPLRKGERPFQWDAVASAAESLLSAAPDLRVALWLLRALLAQQGISGLVQGLARLAELLDLPPDTVFPRALGGESAREAHAVSIAWLGTAPCLHQIRNAPLAPHTALSSAQMRRDAGLATALEGQHKAELVNMLERGLQLLDHIAQTLQQEETYLPFHVVPLHDELAFAHKVLCGHQHRTLTQSPAAAGTDVSTVGPLPSGSLQRREDVQQTLAGLIAYFKEHEPGHPAPLLLQRVQRMLGASFEELMGELYADASQLLARLQRPQPL